ncbi:MAG: M1 family metallopeptidase [Candidatus Limnocylindria bacterium]
MTEDRRDFRLSGDVHPIRYELTFELDLDTWASRGRARIALRLDRRATEVVLHAVDLAIGEAAIAGGPRVASVTYQVMSETATLAFDAEVPPGEHVLELEWTGGISDSLKGLYRSTRADERYAATQFEAADARRAFPCFDEPSFKARFAVTLVHGRGLAAIANAPIASSEELPDGRTRTAFAETPKISTYLVAFTVGPYEATDAATTETGVPVRVWLPPGLADKGAYARDAHVRALEYLERYTGIPYPYTKVDAIGIPDFEAGAMENPGAITYRTRLLSADRATASTAILKAIFSTVAHELTHMWWGDLVTMAWWNDLWLNETFASFVGEKATADLNPEWAFWRDFVAQTSPAFDLDALDSTHPIAPEEVTSAEQASERFDRVTYEKGAAVIRMLENFIGEDAFREGVRAYLRRHAEANATADDFWHALDESSGRDITRIANTWIREPGHPLVTCVARAASGGLDVELRQERFFADPALGGTAQRWPVPLVIRYGTAEGVAEERVLLETERTSVHLPGARWLYPNGGGKGFYRYKLDDSAVAALAAEISLLGAEERLALLDDQWALTKALKAPLSQLFDLLAGLRDEDDRAVLLQIGTILGWLWHNAVGEDQEAAFERFAAPFFERQLARLGWEPRDADSADEREIRAQALGFLARLPGQDALRRDAAGRMGAHLEGAVRLDPDVAGPIATAAALGGDADLYDRYVRRMLEVAANDTQEEQRLRAALADFADPALARRAAGDLFSDLVRPQDRGLLLVRMLALRHSREHAWPSVKRNWDQHVVPLDRGVKEKVLTAIAQLTPGHLAGDAAAFLAQKQTPDIAEGVARVSERLRLDSALADRLRSEMGGALERVASGAVPAGADGR